MSVDLPDFPWDSLAGAKARAGEHPGGIVDLSVGTPVDPTPQVIRDALAQASDAHGYPQTWGTPDLREAVASWFARRRGVPDLDPGGVLPTIGSKEMVAWLPTLLGARGCVAFPSVAYPTYDVGARLAGATPRPVAGIEDFTDGPTPDVLWVNSPSNPTGRVAGVAELRELVTWARAHEVVVASDECYAEIDWRSTDERAEQAGADGPTVVPSILDPRVCDGDHTGLLVCYSLSKQSNLAGYRAAFAAGDPRLVGQLLEVRKHAGMMMPWPVQRAMLAALGDDAHVADQVEIYRRRRDQLVPAIEAAGGEISHSRAGLYLWTTFARDSRATVDALAELGILVAPGHFYGEQGERHVRIALTATDERIAEAAGRLRHGPPIRELRS
ncbi:MAG: succinyldiaminopimelate transaminase [Mobilicoccus sp.]|nr:succinyldiaminopimelate transaminase [Mobilicoccus sp.]